MSEMRKYLGVFFTSFLCCMTAAHANWQYPNRYSRDSWSGDDGMRFVLSVRGGASYSKAKIQNEIGALTGQYVYNIETGEVATLAWYRASGEPAGFADAGYARLGDLPAAKNYSELTVAAGVSAGLTIPDVPQWRIEFGFDHIAEVDYNQNPLFEGVLVTSEEKYVDAQSGGIQSSLSSDIYSAMAFYDFFEGIKKPLKEIIPYIGFGLGYGDTKTILQLTDSYGDLSDIYELQNFGIVDDAGVIQFNKSETRTSNLVPIAAIGISYGMNERMYFDAGIRAMYIPKIKWQLTSADAEKQRDWFTADKMIYVNAMVGLRVEF